MIFEEMYGMVRTPFVRNIPASELYESKNMNEALGRLNYVAQNQLFAVITADAGCGKSTLLRKFNDNLPKDKYVLLYISDSKLTPKWLYTNLLDQLGLESSFYRGDAKKLLQKYLALSIPSIVFSESMLSYLGIINLDDPASGLTSLGTILANGKSSLSTYPHLILFPALVISLLMISFNLFGNGLRDAFNPSLRGTED